MAFCAALADLEVMQRFSLVFDLLLLRADGLLGQLQLVGELVDLAPQLCELIFYLGVSFL